MNDARTPLLPEEIADIDGIRVERTEPPPDPAAGKRAARRARLRAFWAALMYLGIYLGMQLLVAVPYIVLVIMRAVLEFGSDMDALVPAILTTVTENAVLLTTISGVATLLVLWLIFACRKRNFLREIRLVPMRGKPVWALALLGPLANVCIASILALLPEAWVNSYNDTSSLLLGDMSPLFLVFVVLLAPAVEEVVFRGLVYTRLSRALPRPAALLLAAFVFGVMHQHPVWIVYTFLLGLLLCLAMDWYGSLWATLVLHLAFNASSFFTLLLGDLPPILLLAATGPAIALLIRYMYRRAAGHAPTRP